MHAIINKNRLSFSAETYKKIKRNLPCYVRTEGMLLAVITLFFMCDSLQLSCHVGTQRVLLATNNDSICDDLTERKQLARIAMY